MTEGVRSVSNGEQALAYLRREEKYANHPHPDVIFLDLHLPKMSGLEVLAEIKGNPRLLVTPVIVVSGSADPHEIREAYELHASCYVRKPDDLHNFLKFIRICYESGVRWLLFPLTRRQRKLTGLTQLRFIGYNNYDEWAALN